MMKRELPYALLITTIGSLLSHLAYSPKFGFDDANITQTYASNIANGFGYVYNFGSERVEGSTSLLWTLVNTLFFFLSEKPENLISALSFTCTVITVALSLDIARLLKSTAQAYGKEIRYISTATLITYAFFPDFFTYSVWSLMDITPWLLMVTLATNLALRIQISKDSINKLALPITLGLLPMVRPEGIAVSLGISAWIFFHGIYTKNINTKRVAALSVSISALCLASITIFRLIYFGYPLPNTFYAKVSSDLWHQLSDGFIYISMFIGHSGGMILLISNTLAYRYFYRLAATLARSKLLLAWAFTSSIAIGIFSMYAALGGDHFSAFRQLQVLIPIISPFAAFGWLYLFQDWRKSPSLSALTGLLIIGLLFKTNHQFLMNNEPLSHEFRLAEEGRRIGEALNQIPTKPSIGIIAAGGVSRAYNGHIYDLLGLNWTQMAHANPDKSGNLKNHASFDKELFFKTLPEILYIEPSPFNNKVLNKLMDDPRFHRKYHAAQFRGINFYILKNKSLPREIDNS